MSQATMTRRELIETAAIAGGGIAALHMASQATPAVAAEAAALNPQDEDYTSYTVDVAPLFEPLQVGDLTFRNRFVKSPAGSDTLFRNEVNETHVLNEGFLTYYENFAKGGAAAVFMETAISWFVSYGIKEGEAYHNGWLFTQEAPVHELLAPLCERIHKHGAYAGIQLANPSVGDLNEATKELFAQGQDMAVELCQEYQKAGFDLIEIHSSATQWIKNLLSARFNKREDEYGPQSVENRTRFTCELIQKIKAACPGITIQVLMDGVEDCDSLIGDNDAYITIEDSVANAKAFEAAGADTIYLRLSVPGKHVSQFAPDLMFSGYKCEGVTGFGTRFDFSQHFGGMVQSEYSGTAMLLKCAAEFKKNLSIPVSAAGCMDARLAPDLLTNAVVDGKIDYFMMTRALTVDPELPNKLQAGLRDEIAPCCHCLHCHNKGGNALYTRDGGAEYCRVNARTQLAFTDQMPEGYEYIPAETPKKVVVVGAGPAGLEAARVAAMRGHTVTLFEKDAQVGGLVRTAHAFKGEHERLGDLIDYLAHQQEVYGVNVVTGTEATPEIIAAEEPDVVIIATGGKRESKLEGAIPFDEIATADLGERVIILGAGAQAIDATLWLQAQGKKVQIVHADPASEVGKEQSMWVRTYVIPQITSQGTKIWNDCTVDGLSEEGLAITMKWGVQKVLPCDSVVEIYDMVPNTELADALADKYEVYTIGDAASPWNIGLAIRSGNLTARKF
ncbi:MAG: FAD-dependent oxidoreductase [Coriobacteriales bacterium]|nr:FAD-dependent oxidoreductase [Coriobacteriales bacterium]